MPGLTPTPEDYNTFLEITGANQDEARHYLENGTTVQGAIEDFYAAREAGSQAVDDDEEDQDLDDAEFEDATMDDEQPQPAPTAGGSAGGARTLGGQAVDTSLPEGWGKKEKKTGRVGEWSSGGSARRPGEMATLGNTGLRPEPESDSDDEERRRKGNKELYTGGEKSGLAVQNPDRNKGRGIVDEILKQARSEPAAEAPARSGFFGGSGNALGSEDTPTPAPASAAPAPAASGVFGGLFSGLMGGAAPPPPEEEEDEGEVQTRRLVFWRNGFSIEDGPLMLYDTPGNPEILRAIQAGRAPPSLFGVGYNQPLQVEVQQRTNEEYVQQEKPKPEGGFAGGGNRLGSVTPEVSAPAPAAPPLVSQGASTGNSPKFEVDTTQPTTSVQLRLADGSKLVAKVNLTHTVQDLRNFIMAASPSSNSRAFVLQTTFPSKELSDGKLTIEEAGLKNAVVVQRFT